MFEGKRKQQALDILSQWAAYVNSGDIDAVVNLFAVDAVLLPTFSAKILNNTETIRNYFSMLAARPGAGVEIDETSIVTTETTADAVSIAGKYTFYFDEEGKRTAYPSRFTFVMVLNKDRPISHQHSSELPIDHYLIL